MLLVGTLWLVASSDGGTSHGRLPLNGRVRQGPPKQLRLGVGRTSSFLWQMWAEAKPSSPSMDRVCIHLNLVGPLAHAPNGSFGGPEVGRNMCGPIKSRGGIVKAVMWVKGGSTSLPSGETESWQPFSVGAVAFLPFVSQVRLAFSDGGSEVLKARAVPGRLAFKDAEPFHYALFANLGCVTMVQGLAKGKVVANGDEKECGDSSE